MRSREATEPVLTLFMNSRALGASRLATFTVSSVQPSAVISTSSGGGFNCRRTPHVRRKSLARFFVAIMTESNDSTAVNRGSKKVETEQVTIRQFLMARPCTHALSVLTGAHMALPNAAATPIHQFL